MLSNELFEKAIDCGMSVDSYWDSSADEISDYIESYERRAIESKKDEVAGWIHQARLIGESNPMTKTESYTMPWDIFPDLFEKEKEDFEKAQFEKALEKRRRRVQEYQERKGTHGESGNLEGDG